jgi:hypothetical protein
MKFNNQFYSNLFYIILIILFLVIIGYTFSFKLKIMKKLAFRDITNLNSNVENKYNNPIVEGFGSINKNNNDNNILTLIDRKLKGLTEELGGEKGQKEVKEILTNTKKICDLECAKCMMNMIEDNKGIKSIDINKLSQDDSSEDCRKCKSYTSLSKSIQNMIDSL